MLAGICLIVAGVQLNNVWLIVAGALFIVTSIIQGVVNLIELAAKNKW